MSEPLVLRLDILSPWICGSGRGSGRLHDSVGVRDSDGLPYVPGRHLKGILRDAVEQMPPREIGDDTATGEELASFLFGPRASGELREDAASYFFGLLHVSSAIVAPADRAVLLGMDRRDRELALFMTQQSTAIDPSSGTALDKSLRSTQVVVPLTLYAEIGCDASPFGSKELHPFEHSLIAGEWRRIVVDAGQMVRAVGANRQRGSGRVLISPIEDAA